MKNTKPPSYLHEEIRRTGNLPVWFLPYDGSDMFVTNHWHNSLEIVLIKSGQMEVLLADQSVILKPGDFYIINSGDIHATLCREHTGVVLLQIPYRFLENAIPEYAGIRFTGDYSAPDRPDLSGLLYEMEAVYTAHPEGGDELSLKFNSLLYELLYQILRHYRTQVSPSIRVRTERNLKRLESIMDYVRTHYTEPITLKEGASAASLDPAYFCRFFKRYMGMTFLEYVNSVRLQHFYEDLLNTDYTVTELLTRNGFTNYKLFLRLFKQTYGCTPMQKRRI